MRGVLFFLLIIITSVSFAQAPNGKVQSAGLRLGIPVGFTFKNYTDKGKALEFIIGGVSPNYGRHYYVNSFYSMETSDDAHYVSHKVKSSVYLQGRYLLHFQIPISGMEGDFEWYCGAGAVLKYAKVNYRYYFTGQANQNKDVTDFDFGPEVILGFQYTFEDLPFSVYGEGSGMCELFNRFTGRGLGAVGIRYHFR